MKSRSESPRQQSDGFEGMITLNCRKKNEANITLINFSIVFVFEMILKCCLEMVWKYFQSHDQVGELAGRASCLSECSSVRLVQQAHAVSYMIGHCRGSY